MFNHIT